MSYRLECNFCMENIEVDSSGTVPMGWGYLQTEICTQVPDKMDGTPNPTVEIMSHSFMHLCPACVTILKSRGGELGRFVQEGDRRILQAATEDYARETKKES